ncbi:hypothetical protein C8J56DRAFT_197257 [Mycena floridula]|nr:hypothetical protein C8J56DRAFT_197257 [Mycena floridula]
MQLTNVIKLGLPPVTAIKPFPELPFEIVLVIIEEMLELMLPKQVVKFICLSQNIRPIIERALYRTIILYDGSSTVRPAAKFADMIKSRLRPNTFYQNHIKVLCITSVYHSDLITMFPAISGVESLAIRSCFLGKDNVELDATKLNVLTLTGPRPTKLFCSWSWTHPPLESLNSFPLPMLFQNVTHLELCVVPRAFDGKRFHCLKQLTHLSIIDTAGSTATAIWFPALIQRLHLADSIAVCIICSRLLFKDETGNDLPSPDPRVVLVTDQRKITHFDPFIRQWGRRPVDSQEVDMWEQAEQTVIAQRRAMVTLS